MKILTALHRALAGWRAIITGDPEWARHFDRTRSGFITSLVIYLLFAFLALLAGGGGAALNPVNIVIGLLVLALYVLAVVISTALTRLVLRWQGSIFDLLVPATYAMIVYLALGSLTALLGAPMLFVALVVTALLLFRLAQVASGWNLGICAAFAVLTCVLLVAMPMTLYMLASPPASPT